MKPPNPTAVKVAGWADRIVPLEEGYVIEVLNEKGLDLLSSLGDNPTEQQELEAVRVTDQAERKRVGGLDATESGR